MSLLRRFAVLLLPAAVLAFGHASAAPEKPAVGAPSKAPSAAQIVAAAPQGEWVAIAPEDLLVMYLPPREAVRPQLEPAPTPVLEAASATAGPAPRIPPAGAPDAAAASPSPAVLLPLGAMPRRVVIQLIGPPYSQGWVANIRLLASENWWDGLAIVRTQDNYVVQWGDPNAGEPAQARALPGMLQRMPAADYLAGKPGDCGRFAQLCLSPSLAFFTTPEIRDAYADRAGFAGGWPIAAQGSRSWPVHCYGTVGVGRDMSPDTGSGAELYAVIGQAPRQLDRNIAVVGRVIEGMEHLASLPRGTGELGFYVTPEERTPILSVRRGTEIEDLPRYEYLSTSSESFARYVHARANRKDDFYIQPAGAVDVCNVPVPLRQVVAPEKSTGRKRRAK
jgi:cyclophilin family peptidyl-prolyl cis-trans isomerase